MRPLVLAIASAVFLIGSVSSQADEDPYDMWMTGFLQIQDAMKAEAGSRPSLAIAKFQEALWTFHAIARQFPDFESSRRTKRILLLSDKIKSFGGIPVAFEARVRNGAIDADEPQSNLPADRVLSIPSGWKFGPGGEVVLPAVITPETRTYAKAFHHRWVTNGGRYSHDLLGTK